MPTSNQNLNLSQLCNAVALRALYGITMNEIIDMGLALRKGKTSDDVKTAIKKGFAQGIGKVEREIMFAAGNLERVVKLSASRVSKQVEFNQ